MKPFPRIGLIVLLAFALAAIAVTADSGCCCNLEAATAQVDSYLPSSECLPEYPDFVAPTATDIALNKSCSTKCGEVTAIPNVTTGACGSASFNPAPGNLSVVPVKGKRAIKLSWNQVCVADAYVISRCTGTSCSNFQQVAIIGPASSFIDGSPELRWNTAYTYKVIAKYSIQGDSPPATKSVNTGDLECENQYGLESFCISSAYYNSFKTYLQTYGYAGDPATAASAFVNFDSAVSAVFFTKFNKAAACDVDNKLSIILPCDAGTICVAQGLTPSCRSPGPCDPNEGIFGLGATVDQCEGTAGNENYCFLDRSQTSVDTCYICNQGLNCYDYKSKGACERNNCGLGACEWVDTFSDVGSGVCVDKRFNNCAWCDKQGTAGAPTYNSYNNVFDQCTPQKAIALSTPEHQCFYTNGQASDCSTVTCKDYTPGQCSSPQGAIQLNPDNSIANPSTDPCGIKVCQYDSSVPLNNNPGCHKNADATPLTSYWPDCGVNDPVCERDYFPALTTLIPTGSAGKYDYLDVRLWERSNATEFGHLVQPSQQLQFCVKQCDSKIPEYVNWGVFFCAGAQGGTPCTNFVATNFTQLNFNDLELKQGNTTLLTMSPGWNTLRYYSKDPNKNLEVIKTFNVFACTACQGPKMLTLNITPGRKVNGTYYTNSHTPVTIISYNEPADQTFAGFVQGTDVTELDKSPASGFNGAYTLTVPSGTSLAEGKYIFSANARDTNNVYMDAPVSVPAVVDTTPPIANYTPTDSAVLSTGSTTLKVNFSEPVIVQNFTLIEYVIYNTSAGPISVPEIHDITGLFAKGNDNRTYTATLTLTEGKKIIRPIVTDYAGNPLSPATNSSLFVVNAAPPIVTLKLPPYGVSSTFSFPFAVETDSVAECRYWSSQTVPPPGLFTALQPFDSTNDFVHLKNVFNEITKENTPYKVYVRCVDPVTGTGSSTFYLTVDTSPPKIVTAFAIPNPIVQMPLQTTLKVQTDDLTFCKYSNTTNNYDLMEGVFPMFGILGLQGHAVNVTVPAPASYTYKIACKNLAGLGPASASVTFSVNLNLSLTVKSIVPPFVGNVTVPLGVETNKDTFCYYEQDGALLPIGSTDTAAMAHTTLITVPGPGPYSIPVTCATGSGTSAAGIEQKTINVTFYVDTTPPDMLYADDTSNNPEWPQYSYFKNQLRIAMNGTDNESNVSRYHYLVQEKATSVVLKNWTPSVILDGLPWWVTGLNLTNGTSYYFRVKAENKASLLSTELPSDGVIIDFSKIPPQCLNQLFDVGNETDVDCGAICPQCADYKKCAINSDCMSRICNASKICQPSLCTDKINGGNETDIDCGGNQCPQCANNKTCAINEDCMSNYCDAGICSDNPCKNGKLDGLESDIDCGGACSQKCGVGQSCTVSADCINGTSCVNGVCAAIADEDGDGVPDALDKCPGTPSGEVVDEYGCSASQRHSCGDEIPDSWRILFFGDVICEGDAAADADPDGDGLTNLEEFRLGKNPLVSDGSGLGWLWWLLLLLLLLLIVLGYLYYRKKPEEVKRRLRQFRKSIPFLAPEAPPLPPAPEKKQPETPHLEDWLSVADLKKLGPEDVSAKTFGKLDAFIKGELAEREHPKLLKQLEREETPLDRLRELALAGLSPKERKELLLKLRLLRRGKLTKEEMEELFRKLRITAAYYATHKAELEAELEAFVRGEKRKRRR
ncbi:MAG TPA: hypothetical protein VLJ21_05255 [Candidatus Binatia bacterium]|nr:hypothetical protein [Candidatus Binatia bacterium]